MKHSKTARTLKQTPSTRQIDHLLSKRILPKSSKIITQRQTTQSLSSPQKRLRNWCNIQESILHNIYDLKQMRIDQKEFASVNRYEQLLMKITGIQGQIKMKKGEEEKLRGQLIMMKQDKIAKELRNIDLVCEHEQLDEILEVYSKKFPEQSSNLFSIVGIQIQLSSALRQLSLMQSQLQDLNDNITQKQPCEVIAETGHLDHRIHNHRLKLLQLQQKLNQLCQQIGQPLLRQILCHFYIQHNQSENVTKDSQQIGIQLWICKNNLVNIFDKYIFNNYQSLKQAGKGEYQQYLQVLTKIQMNYVQIQRLVTITEQDNNQQDRQIYNQKTRKVEELKQKIHKLKQQKQNIEHSLNQIQQNQQLFKLQCDLGKFDAKILIKQIITQQNRRISNIKTMRIRYISLNQFRSKANNRNQNLFLIIETSQLLDKKRIEINTLNHQLDKLNQQRIKKEIRFSGKSNTKTQFSPQHIDVRIQALEKKLTKLNTKKQNIINSRHYQTPNLEKQPLKENNSNMLSPIATKKKSSKVNSKSASKLGKSTSTYHTIAIKPYQPLDKAITKLVSFKKTLASDKIKLNKALSKLMKNI